LREFRQLVHTYFSDTGLDGVGRRHEAAAAREARGLVNLKMTEAVRSCGLIGHSLEMLYGPAPAQGGFTSHINVITNLFNLDRLRIPPAKALDLLDRAIGDYARMEAKLLRRSFNPFYWLWLLFINLLRLPFRIFGAAGYDARAIEQAWVGKLLKAFMAFVIFVAALLQALSLLGLPTSLGHIIRLVWHR